MTTISALLRSARQAVGIPATTEGIPSLKRLTTALSSQWRSFSATTAAPTGDAGKDTVAEDPLGHATGLERAELEAKARGVSLTEEEWLSAPFGTVEKPVEVTSIYEERIVGVPDPDDDCIITWGVIREGEPPRQIVDGGEYFVLKRKPVPDWAPDS